MKKIAAAACVVLLAGVPLRAEEGLWLFNQFPKQLVEKQYGFRVTDSFLDHLRLSSVRFNNGGSGSFVSPDGLLFTNHHVGADCIQKLSSARNDYMSDGFYAATQAGERGCPDLEVNVLLKIEDVSAKVNEGIKADLPTAEVNRLQKANMTRLEKECTAATGNRCDVVTLFSGGRFHLYQYKKYTDVRLVLAPEHDVAAFGGDPDNFTYPRYCLDFALFRAYENGKPARVSNHFKWSRAGAKEGELIFVPGHPGTTGRLSTYSELEFSRDISYPVVLDRLQSLVTTLERFSAQSPENARIARENLQSQQNSVKAFSGFLSGLKNPELMKRKLEDERKLRQLVEADPARKQKYAKTWPQVAAAYQEYAQFWKAYWLIESRADRGTDLLRIARTVVRYAEERAKPSDQRLREYRDSAIPSLEQELYSEAPVHPSMEIAVLADYIEFLRRELGAGDPTVKAVLNGRTPREAAEHYVNTSKLAGAAERRRLSASAQAVRSSDDGMIRLALILDQPARELRKRYEDKVEAVVNSSAGKIAQARFDIFGETEYPDATFTLRLSYAAVKGYTNDAGQPVPYATDFAGMYRRATGKDPYKLPDRWLKAKSSLNLKTPYNFVSTADTHGGNSGSPTLNTRGEVVGILFDGNIEGLPNRFVFTDKTARSVHVASQGIIESLKKVFKADRILKELGQE